MGWTPKLLSAAVTVAVVASVAAPLQPASGQEDRGRQWQIDYGEYRCTLSRLFGQTAPLTLAIRIVPGEETADLIIINPAWPRGGRWPEGVQIVFQPSGARLSGEARSGEVPSSRHRFMRISDVERGFFDQLASARSLSIEGEGRELVSVELDQIGAGLTALRNCHNDLMRGWGVDPTVIAGLSRRPVPIGRTRTMMASHEPLAARDSESSVFVIIRFTVDPNGRVVACQVVRSGGADEAARMVCRRAERDARYEPALGADGRPVAVQLIQTMPIVRRPA
jgi:TonB family protein